METYFMGQDNGFLALHNKADRMLNFLNMQKKITTYRKFILNLA